MNEELVAQIIVPTTGKTDGDTIYRYGSGYLIGRDKVLTARHVVVPGDRDAGAPIEVRFVKVDRDRWIKARVVWPETENLDAALLELDQPADRESNAFLSSWVPETGKTWDARGYPAVARSARPGLGISSEIEPFQGDTYSYQPGDNECKLDVNRPPPDARGWEGMSGAAVFAGDRLFAIVCSSPDAFVGKCLRATPTSALLKEPELLAELGIDHKYLERTQAEIERLLEKEWTTVGPVLTDNLNKMKWTELDDTPGGVAELVLWALRDDEMLDLMHRAHKELAVDHAKRRGVEVIEQILWAALPCLHQPNLIRALRSAAGEAAVLITVQIATRTIVEVVSAGIDNRPAVFRRLESRIGLPDGGFRIEDPPECGTDLAKFHTGVRSDLANQLLDESLRSRSGATVDRLINKEIRFLAEQAGEAARYYLVLDAKLQDDYRAQLVNELRRVYPALRIFMLEPCDDEALIREVDLCRYIREIVRSSQG
jgi:hypothetical protein